MLEGLVAKFALGFAWSKAKAISGWSTMSPKMHLYIIGAVAVVVLGLLHQHVAKVKLHNQYKDGYAQAQVDDAKKLKDANARITALSITIAADERKKNDEKVVAISAHADAVRLSGPGKAVCPAPPPAPGGYQARPGSVDTGLDRVPYPQWQQLLGVPFDDSVTVAKQCDINSEEVRRWHSWYDRLVAAWPKAQP
jgi:hypothetical protein